MYLCLKHVLSELCLSFTDQEHGKDQEDEEETPEENREERHAGSGAELADAELAKTESKNQSAKKVTSLGVVSPKQRTMDTSFIFYFFCSLLISLK